MFRTPPPAKRPRTAESEASPALSKPQEVHVPSQVPVEPRPLNTAPPPLPPGPSSRKRPASPGITLDPRPPPPVTSPGESSSAGALAIGNLVNAEDTGKKRSRTNTPWTAAEEHRLKQMRDAGNTWSEIAKVSSPLWTRFGCRGSFLFKGIPKQNRRQREETLVQGSVLRHERGPLD